MELVQEFLNSNFDNISRSFVFFFSREIYFKSRMGCKHLVQMAIDR